MTALVPVALDDPRAVALLGEFTAEMARRYPGSEPSHVEADDFPHRQDVTSPQVVVRVEGGEAVEVRPTDGGED